VNWGKACEPRGLAGGKGRLKIGSPIAQTYENKGRRPSGHVMQTTDSIGPTWTKASLPKAPRLSHSPVTKLDPAGRLNGVTKLAIRLCYQRIAVFRVVHSRDIRPRSGTFEGIDQELVRKVRVREYFQELRKPLSPLKHIVKHPLKHNYRQAIHAANDSTRPRTTPTATAWTTLSPAIGSCVLLTCLSLCSVASGRTCGATG